MFSVNLPAHAIVYETSMKLNKNGKCQKCNVYSKSELKKNITKYEVHECNPFLNENTPFFRRRREIFQLSI